MKSFLQHLFNFFFCCCTNLRGMSVFFFLLKTCSNYISTKKNLLYNLLQCKIDMYEWICCKVAYSSYLFDVSWQLYSLNFKLDIVKSKLKQNNGINLSNQSRIYVFIKQYRNALSIQKLSLTLKNSGIFRILETNFNRRQWSKL